MAQSLTAKRRLVLHFDLNNTILMQDMSKGLNTIENVARIVCKSAWGRLISNKVKNEKTYTWELAHDQLTISKPESLNLLANLPSTDAKDVQIATYMDYIDAAYPNLVGTESSEEKAEREEIRKKLRIKFSQPGGAGSKFKNTYEKIIKQLAQFVGRMVIFEITFKKSHEKDPFIQHIITRCFYNYSSARHYPYAVYW